MNIVIRGIGGGTSGNLALTLTDALVCTLTRTLADALARILTRTLVCIPACSLVCSLAHVLACILIRVSTRRLCRGQLDGDILVTSAAGDHELQPSLKRLGTRSLTRQDDLVAQTGAIGLNVQPPNGYGTGRPGWQQVFVKRDLVMRRAQLGLQSLQADLQPLARAALYRQLAFKQIPLHHGPGQVRPQVPQLCLQTVALPGLLRILVPVQAIASDCRGKQCTDARNL